jgi:hypothetical protein
MPYPFQRLEISDGDTTVSLLSPESGFYLREWNPILGEPKAGGVWKDSQLADGRQLGLRKRANIIDSLVLDIRDYVPDDLIRDTQNLRRLLEKACYYRTSKWQDEPVWIVRQGAYESNPTYSLIEDYRTPQDGNPHGSNTFWNRVWRKVAFPVFNLIVEHEPWWTGNPPGTGTCVQARGMQANWEYEDWTINTNQPSNQVWSIIEATCGNMLATDLGGEVWRTANGTVWVASTTPPATTDPVALLEASDGDIFCTGWGAKEVWRSTDCGVNWVRQSATVGSTVDAGRALAELGSWLYISTGGLPAPYRDIRRSNDDGATWNIVFTASSGTGQIISASDSYLYAVVDDRYIYRSSDGTTWNPIYFNGEIALGSGMIRFITELSDGYIYAGIYTGSISMLARSANGTDWAICSEENSFRGLEPGDMILTSDGYYYLVIYSGEVYRSTDAISWKLLDDILAAPPYGLSGLVEYSGNDRIYFGEYGDIWWGPSEAVTLGRDETCTEEVYVTNKNKYANMTHIWGYEASGPTWTARFPSAVFPFQLLPAVMANNDVIYFGIDPTVSDAGPFDNLIFDIGTPAFGVFTLTWQYSNGAAGWPTLNVQDNTASFTLGGVNSVHWVPPSAWATEGVNGVTCLWVRAIVSAVTGSPTGPTQDNRDVYTCNWPHIDVDSAQVLGDIPALMQFRFHNQSDEDGYVTNIDELDLLENRVVAGLRSMSRGELPSMFCAFLNCADEQNPTGISVSVGAASAFADDITAPSGRRVTHTTTGTSTWADEVIFSFSSTVIRDYYGTFHAYVRAMELDRNTAMDEVRVRLQIRTGSGGVTFTTDHKPFRNLNDWQLLDFKSINIPVSGLLSSDDLGDEGEIAIQVWSDQAALTVKLYDLILMPTDEWAGDFVDKALEDDSGVCNGYLLDVDSVSYPKRDIRALVRRADPAGHVRSIYQANPPGPAILQSNQNQRLWFLTARGVVTGAHTGANNQTTLTDANASFLTSGVETGQYIFNITDGSSGFVGVTVTATTITDCDLDGGTDDDWDTNDEYLIICPNWASEPWNCHTVQLWINQRYLSMRGNR